MTKTLPGLLLLAGIACQAQRTPVVVELFTSEGCSSCPPADDLIAKLDREQPVAGAEVIVLSEHVDYWNHLGWKDPFSSALFSRRQENYARRMNLQGPYTPQMVVDGTAEFVGNDARQAVSAVERLARGSKPVLKLSRKGDTIEVQPPENPVKGKVETWLAIAEDATVSEVSRGENKGRTLHHVAVVRTLQKSLQLPANTPKTARIIVFLQEPNQGRIRAAAILR